MPFHLGTALRLRLGLILSLSLSLSLPTEAEAQRRGRGNMMGMLGDPTEFYTPPDFSGNTKYDGRFVFARLKYRGFQCYTGQGPGWSHDYPRAESHFMRILKTVTSLRPFIEQGPITGGNILALDDPELAKYPVAYLSEPGGWQPNDSEAKALGNYLTKGGFLIVDDFEESCTGGGDMINFQAQLARTLPKARLIEIPATHPIFDSFFKVDVELLGGRGGGGFGRGGRGGVTWYGVFQDNDPKKRLMIVANYGLDIGELMEYSDQGFNPVPANEAYKLGVNYLIYALTH